MYDFTAVDKDTTAPLAAPLALPARTATLSTASASKSLVGYEHVIVSVVTKIATYVSCYSYDILYFNLYKIFLGHPNELVFFCVQHVQFEPMCNMCLLLPS